MVQWIAAYVDLEKYVRAHEPSSCLTYYFGTPAEYGGQHSSSPQMLAFEQYRVRSDLYEIHFHSAAMDTFLAKIPPTMTTSLDLTHYEDVAGFLDKPGDMTECALFYDTRITCAPEKREAVLAGLKTVAGQVEREEKGTYTYLVLRSLDTEDGVRVFERYASKEAMEEHWKGKALLEFFMGSKEIIKSMEGRSYVPNGYGWLHR